MTTIKDIAGILVVRHQLKNADAVSFLQQMVEVINEGLIKDRQVKIKGFGTFKLQNVKERSSVNVNTGERVVISEHNKVTFTPDNVMRDLINKPFSQFETVIVEEGSPLLLDDNIDDEEENTLVETEEPDAIETQETQEIQETPEVPEAIEPVDAPEIELSKDVVTDDADTEEDDNSEKESSESDEEETLVEAEKAVIIMDCSLPLIKEEVTVDSEEDPKVEAKEDPKVVVEEDPKVVVEEEAKEVVEEEEPEEESEIEVEPVESASKNTLIYYGILINIIVAMLFAALGYFACYKGWFSTAEPMKVEIVSPSPKAKPEPAKPVKEEAKPEPSVKEEPAKEETKPEQVKPEPAKEEPSKPAEPAKEEVVSMDKYNKDARVRTGAYVIIGTDKEVTVREGQTLKSISRANLGPDMECYVEAYNNTTTVKAGQKIKIPKLKLKKR